MNDQTASQVINTYIHLLAQATHQRVVAECRVAELEAELAGTRAGQPAT